MFKNIKCVAYSTFSFISVVQRKLASSTLFFYTPKTQGFPALLPMNPKQDKFYDILDFTNVSFCFFFSTSMHLVLNVLFSEYILPHLDSLANIRADFDFAWQGKDQWNQYLYRWPIQFQQPP